MRLLTSLAVLALALVACGCGDLLSLHALHTAQDRVFDPAIEGRWENDDQLLTVERTGDLYQAKLQSRREPETEPRDYHVHLVDIAGVRFANVLWTEAVGHMIVRVRVADGQMHLAFFDSKWLRDRVPHEEADVNNGAKQAVLTLPTPRLRALVAKYAREPGAYDARELVYRRAVR